MLIFNYPFIEKIINVNILLSIHKETVHIIDKYLWYCEQISID
jgi:hypothetical protein